MNNKLLWLPLVLFLLLAGFLFKGLFEDPRELESVLVGKPLPPFELRDLYQPDVVYAPESLQGKPFLLNVWAAWCPTCYAEHSFLNKLAAQGVRIVGLNYKDDRQKAINWLNELKDPYQMSLSDPDGMLGMDLGVYGAPETFFVDSQGMIHYRHVGDVNPQNWQQQLQAIYEGMQ